MERHRVSPPDSEHSDYSTQELQLLSGICYVYYVFTPCLQHTTSSSDSGIPSLTLGYVCTEEPIIPARRPCMPPGGYKKLEVCPGLTRFAGTQALLGRWGCRCQLSCAPGLTLSVRGHFTFITASKPELMILKACFCLSRCMWLFPSTKRNMSTRFQTGNTLILAVRTE